jgi:hypothetical protein
VSVQAVPKVLSRIRKTAGLVPSGTRWSSRGRSMAYVRAVTRIAEASSGGTRGVVLADDARASEDERLVKQARGHLALMQTKQTHRSPKNSTPSDARLGTTLGRRQLLAATIHSALLYALYSLLLFTLGTRPRLRSPVDSVSKSGRLIVSSPEDVPQSQSCSISASSPLPGVASSLVIG